MDSPSSSVIADIVVQDLEKITLESFINEIPFYYRYVDDILAAVRR